MMWIKTDRDELKRLKDPRLDSPLVLSSKNTVQVSDDVGAYVIEAYDSFYELNADTNEDDDEDKSDEKTPHDAEAGDEDEASGNHHTEKTTPHEAHSASLDDSRSISY